MHSTYDNHRSLYLTIIFSLLLHSLFVSYFIIFYQPSIVTKNDTERLKEEVIKQDAEWVETKTRFSDNTPTYFNDPFDDHNDNDSDVNKAIDTTEPVQADEKNDEPSRDESPEKATTVASKKKSAAQTPAHHRPTPPPLPTPQQAPQQRSAQKQLPSLAQLTQGVLNYMKEEGKHSVSMLGKKSGTPTDEQLKYERYLERLNQCLHNSFVINSYKQPTTPPPLPSITVYLALNQDGSIYNLKVVKSSGSMQVDMYIMSVLRDASSSFPPVPHYLPHNPFSINYLITLKASY